MTAPEALAELRRLALRFRAEVPGDTFLLNQVIDTFSEVAADGVNPIIELRIRRFRRLAGDGHAAGHSNGVTR